MTKKKSRMKKRSRTFIVLYYWGKILGINPLNLLENGKLEFSYFSLFYNCLLVIIYCYAFYRGQIEHTKYSLPGTTPISLIVNLIWRSSVFFEITINWLIFGFRQNRIVLIVKSFMRAEKIAEKLGIPQNYKICWRKLGIYLLFTSAYQISAVIINNTLLAIDPNFHKSIWTVLTIMRTPFSNMMMLFVWCLVIVRQKFRRLNENMDLLMQYENGVSNCLTNPELTRNFSYKRIRISDKINMISQLHRELRDLIRRIEGYFALLMLLNLVEKLSNLALNVYLIHRYLGIQDTPDRIGFLYISVITYWTLFPIASLTILSNVCGSTLHEANKTGSVLHSMLNIHDNFGDPREFAEFHVLSLDLHQNPVTISTFGLFDLDYFLVYRIIATATTYLVIMLQFYA